MTAFVARSIEPSLRHSTERLRPTPPPNGATPSAPKGRRFRAGTISLVYCKWVVVPVDVDAVPRVLIKEAQFGLGLGLE